MGKQFKGKKLVFTFIQSTICMMNNTMLNTLCDLMGNSPTGGEDLCILYDQILVESHHSLFSSLWSKTSAPGQQ